RRARTCRATSTSSAPSARPCRASSASIAARGRRVRSRRRSDPFPSTSRARSATRIRRGALDGLLPLESPLSPHVDVREREDDDEEQELDEPEPRERVEDHREWVEKDDLD